MRIPLSACCKNSPCAEVDGCERGVVSVFRIVDLMGSFRDGVSLDEPLPLALAVTRALTDSLRDGVSLDEPLPLGLAVTRALTDSLL